MGGGPHDPPELTWTAKELMFFISILNLATYFFQDQELDLFTPREPDKLVKDAEEPVILDSEPVKDTVEPVRGAIESIKRATELVTDAVDPVILDSEPVKDAEELVILDSEPNILDSEPVKLDSIISSSPDSAIGTISLQK